MITLVLSLFLVMEGCGCVKKTAKVHPSTSSETLVNATSATGVSVATFTKATPVLPSSSEDSFEKRAISDMEQAVKMLKTSNLGGALRLIDRVQQSFPHDNYINMQAWYIKAMIFHRQKDFPKRKEAMNSMLKSIEEMQKDPKYRSAVEEGQQGADLIKMSIEKKGRKFENN
ncbi:MAG: hypothetical protein HQM08_20585 [Candidatus Riflebacteria bacterium]|nr:hypothetical protein [Candidatus Riflebacteria bacterium]